MTEVMRDGRDAAVVIAGGGPTGLMLAGELKLAGIDVVVVEKRVDQEIEGVRARGCHARTLEVFDQRGIVERFLEAGKPMQVYGLGGVHLDISDFPSRHPYGLALRQKYIEAILLGWVEELGVEIWREREVTGFVADADGVEVTLGDGQRLRALYLVGCDGGRSLVRKLAEIAFVGSDATVSQLIAEVQLAEEPEQWGIRSDPRGVAGLHRDENGIVHVLVPESVVGKGEEPALAELSAAMIAVFGSDYGVHSPKSLSRFTDAARQAAEYRRGRVLLAGDAAHVHYPAGGYGLNLGVQDAVNLGWKLAQVVKGVSAEDLLDSYGAERRPVGARVLRDTLAAVAMGRTDERSQALRDIVGELLAVDGARKALAGRMSGLELRYDLGEGHPLLGRRMPDLEVTTAAGPMRVYTLLHRARPLLVDFGRQGRSDLASWADRVQMLNVDYDGKWELPVIGDVAAPAAVLVRPDGYVAWLDDGTGSGLYEALTKWFGPPRV